MSIVFKCKNCGENIIISYLKPGEITKCRLCGTENIVPNESTENIVSGKDAQNDSKETNQSALKPVSVKKRSSFEKYPALTTISAVLKIAAYVVLFVSIGLMILGFTLLEGYDKTPAIVMIALSMLSGFIGFISILAYSELIKVFLDIENNTRN